MEQDTNRYVKVDRGCPVDAESPRLFLSLHRRPAGTATSPLDDRAVQHMLKSAAARAGITSRVNPHTFWQWTIANALRAGINPVVLAQRVGHADLSVITSTYSHLMPSDQAR